MTKKRKKRMRISSKYWKLCDRALFRPLRPLQRLPRGSRARGSSDPDTPPASAMSSPRRRCHRHRHSLQRNAHHRDLIHLQNRGTLTQQRVVRNVGSQHAMPEIGPIRVQHRHPLHPRNPRGSLDRPPLLPKRRAERAGSRGYREAHEAGVSRVGAVGVHDGISSEPRGNHYMPAGAFHRRGRRRGVRGPRRRLPRGR